MKKVLNENDQRIIEERKNAESRYKLNQAIAELKYLAMMNSQQVSTNGNTANTPNNQEETNND